MNIKTTVRAALFVIFFTGTIYAQEPKQRQVRFTSVYTSLGQGCKVLKGSNGTDDGSLCKGPGGYRIRVYSSAAATHIVAEIKGKDDLFLLATVSIGFDEGKTRLEWRLANGKPFAVIMRVPQYGPVTDDDPYFGEAVGQELIVRGLKGFGNINSSVGTRASDANAKARKLADSAYTTGK